MIDEELLIEKLYHCLQHIESYLDSINTDTIENIKHTVNHSLNLIDDYYDKNKETTND